MTRTLDEAARDLSVEFGGQIVIVRIVAVPIPKLETAAAGVNGHGGVNAMRLAGDLQHAANEHWHRVMTKRAMKRGPG